eukprot:scaffold7688_cov130-Isochrysis_galbana.AAC.20
MASRATPSARPPSHTHAPDAWRALQYANGESGSEAKAGRHQHPRMSNLRPRSSCSAPTPRCGREGMQRARPRHHTQRAVDTAARLAHSA